MWTLIACLSSECNDSKRVESPPISLDAPYIWKNTKLFLEGYTLDNNYNSLVLSFILQSPQGRVLITQIPIPVKSIEHYHEVAQCRRKSLSIRTRDSVYENLSQISTTNHHMKITVGETIVELSYVAYSYKSLDDGVTPLGQIHIISLFLERDISVPLHVGHKITCLINDTYLGRAQECITHNSARSMIWNPIEDSEEWPTSPRGEHHFNHLQEENRDLDFIRRADPSGVGSKFIDVHHVEDNDAYSNPIRRLPRYFNSDDPPLRIKLYNFKFTPPRCIECAVKWSDFENGTCLLFRVPTPRKFALFKRKAEPLPTIMTGVVEKHLVKDIMLRISYKMQENLAQIECIKLHVANYETTLDLDAMQEAKTV